jgi:adenine-specific DNA-methyltransferase
MVIDDPAQNCLIRVPVDGRDAEVMQLVESLPLRFLETGLRISTGPVVLFRAKEFLVEEPHGQGAVPLLLPHNIKPFQTIWPIRKQRKPAAFRACSASHRLLLPTMNYVLVKRFSAKEEPRRLTAGCLLGAGQPYQFVALENHLNYVCHRSRELSENEVFGVAAILNSELFDRYFRLVSGSTQVNATELRLLKFPSLDVVEKLGKRVLRSLPLNETALEDMVLETLAATGPPSPAFAESLT